MTATTGRDAAPAPFATPSAGARAMSSGSAGSLPAGVDQGPPSQLTADPEADAVVPEVGARIGVEPGRARQVVGEQLEGDRQDDRGEPLRRRRETKATPGRRHGPGAARLDHE